MKRIIFFLTALVIFATSTYAQNIVLEVDGDNLNYTEGGCGDCNGDPDPRWRARLLVNGSPIDWNVDRDDFGCGWSNSTNYSWYNPTVVGYSSTVAMQMDGSESDGGLCFGSDASCGGYGTVNSAFAATSAPPCQYNYYTGFRTCCSDGTCGDWGIEWSTRWYYDFSPTLSNHVNLTQVRCQGQTPANLSVDVNTDANGRSLGRWFRWQISNTPNGPWVDIPGASGFNSGTTFTRTPGQISGTRYYRLQATSNCNFDFSSYTTTSQVFRVTYGFVATGAYTNQSGYTYAAGDQAPAIQAGVCGNTVLPAQSITFPILLSPNGGAATDFTSITWSATGGTPTSGSGTSFAWTAPTATGAYSVSATYNYAGCSSPATVTCNVSVGSPSCNFAYVAAGGSDVTTNGGPNNPYATISYAIANLAGRTHIKVAGNVTENNIVNIPTGVTIEGGYSNGSGLWVKNNNTLSTITCNGSEYVSGVCHRMGFRAASVSNWSLIDLIINTASSVGMGADASGRGCSNYGLYLDNTSNYNVIRCQITANTGGTGNNGGGGATGAGGSGGGSGQDGSGNDTGFKAGGGGGAGGSVAWGANGGNGGAGGSTCGNSCGSAGSAGGIGWNNQFGAACAGGGTSTGSNCSRGDGGNACNGSGYTTNVVNTPGINGGTAGDASSYGTYYAQNGTGAQGGHGRAGNGGGGGGASRGESTCFWCACFANTGNGGGGGGGGGAGGQGGFGGLGGGGSFGIYRTSTATTSANFVSMTVASGAAGSGGAGGQGGDGGGGGTWGNGPNTDSGNRANAGDGGVGGSGARGGTGQNGANGATAWMYTVGVGATNPSSSIATSPVMTVNYNNTSFCQNSQIRITKASGTWALPSPLALVNLQASGVTGQLLTDNSIIIANTANVGSLTRYDFTSPANVPSFLIQSPTARTLPTISVNGGATTICQGGSVTLTNSGGTGTILNHDWRIFTTDARTPIAGLTSSLSNPTLSVAGLTPGTYNVYYSQLESCCGWSIPVYTTFTIVADPIAPTLLAATPNVSSVCVGGSVSATVNAGSQGVGCTDQYQISTNSGSSYVAYSPGTSVTVPNTPGQTIIIQARRDCSGNGCDGPAETFATLYTWTIIADPVAETATQAPVICQGTTTNITASATGGNGTITNVVFEQATNIAGPWTNVQTGSSTTYALPTSLAAGTYFYRSTITQSVSGCASVPDATPEQVTIIATPTVTISGGTTVCQNGTNPNITFTNGTSSNIIVTYNINGGASQTISVLASSTNTVSQSTATAGSFAYNLVSVEYTGSLTCTATATGTATIVVRPTPTATISGTTTVCQGVASPNITFTNPMALPVTVTYNINGGANTTINVGANTTATFAQGTGTAGTFNYNLVSVEYQTAPTCSNTITGTATVTVNPTPTASISGTTTVCQNSGNQTITFTNPQSLPVTITYTLNGGANQTINVGANSTATLSQATTTAGTFTYALVNVFYQSGPACTATLSATAVVTVRPTPTASISGTVDVCVGSPSQTVTFTNPMALPVTVTYNINGGSNTTINVGANTTATLSQSAATAGAFAYNLVSVAYQTAPTCSNTITGTATVTVRPTPTATVTGTVTVCQNDANPNLTFTNPQGFPITVNYTVNGTPQAINVPANSTNAVAHPTVANGIYVYSITSVVYQAAPSCTNSSVSSTATVTVRSTPFGTISGTATICNGGNTTLNFTGAPNTVITLTNGQTVNIGGGGTGTLSVSPTSTTTYTIANAAYPSAPLCTETISGQAVTVTVVTAPIQRTVNVQQPTICSGTAGALIVVASESGTSYQLVDVSGGNVNVGAAQTGNGSNLTFTTQTLTTNNTFKIVATRSPCSSIDMDNGGTETINIVPAGSWLGAFSNDWYDPQNWCGGVPTATSDITIPNSILTNFDPELNNSSPLAGIARVRNLTIAASGSLAFNGNDTLNIHGDFTRTGTFNPGTGTMHFRGNTNTNITGTVNFFNVRVEKGSSIATTVTANNNVTIQNNLKLNLGMYQQNAGVLSVQNVIQTIDANAGIAFNNASSLAQGSFGITNNGLFRVQNTASVSIGDASDVNFINNSGATFEYTSSGTSEIAGRFDNAGTFTQSGTGILRLSTFGVNSATAVFNANGASTIGATGGTIEIVNANAGSGEDVTIISGAGTKSFGTTNHVFQIGNASTPASSIFKINNTAVDFANFNVSATNSPTARLLTNVIANNVIVNGRIDLNSNTLRVKNNATTAISGTGRIISETTNTNSRVRWDIGTGTGAYVVPFGNNFADDIAFTFNITTAGVGGGHMVFSTYPTADDNTPWAPTVTNMTMELGGNGTQGTLDRWWNIDANAYTTKPVATMTFKYADTDLAGNANIDESFLRAQKWREDSVDWVNPGFFPSNTSNPVNNTVTVTGVTNYSPWVLHDGTTNGNSPLPISLLSFKAACENQVVNINWSTASEQNNDYFTVQRSKNATDFETVAIVQGAGNSNSTLNYNTKDNYPYGGTSYYRLMQTDFNGDFEVFSPVAVVCITGTNDAISLYPNPANTLVNVDLNISGSDEGQILVYDALGRKVLEQDVKPTQGANNYVLDIAKLNQGQYSIKFNLNNRTLPVQRLVIQR